MLKEVLEMLLIEIDWCGLCDVSIPAMHGVLIGPTQMTFQTWEPDMDQLYLKYTHESKERIAV